ncbi:MAG: alcohol dehydrogenase catalytic domain-containing protein [Leptonema sp. (in: Bacteria)]|nr:alcohol dehydrogenase catalytic domain-containing protein [Leptonema sp. (in: bacteria)]
MKAAVLDQNQRKLRIAYLATPKPKPNQVRIRVKACGVCGSDLHLVLHGTMKPSSYPRIPGHEVSGVIDELGDTVKNFSVGDRVIVAPGISCGQCSHCIAGNDNLCKQVGVFGFQVDGGYAEQMVVDERYLIKLPNSIPFEVGAILADAVSTPYHAVKYRGELKAGETVAIFGTGGLGVHAVAIAKALDAGQIIALDIDSSSLENAVYYGATQCINLKDESGKFKNPGKLLKELSGGVDLLLDFSGQSTNISESVRAMNRGGRMILVGIGRSPLNLAMPFLLIERQLTIRGSYGSNRQALPELIQLIEDGKLDLSHSVSSVHPLEEVNQCLEKLEQRQGNPIRMVLNP